MPETFSTAESARAPPPLVPIVGFASGARGPVQTSEGIFPWLQALLKLPGGHHSRLRKEIAALQQVIAQMREELQTAQEQEQGARHLALHDDLTALPNRRFFRERLERALSAESARPAQLAVIYLDLDGFKTLNDEFGHDIGDRVINLVAARLKHTLRPEDFVSRLGGDEYACLVTGVPNRERLQRMAETLYEAISQPLAIGALMVKVCPSIGIAMFPDHGKTADALLKAGDLAMYRAKRSRSTWAFSAP